MALGQLSQAECVKMRGQFLRLLDSKTCLTLLNINILCLPPLTFWVKGTMAHHHRCRIPKRLEKPGSY